MYSIGIHKFENGAASAVRDFQMDASDESAIDIAAFRAVRSFQDTSRESGNGLFSLLNSTALESSARLQDTIYLGYRFFTVWLERPQSEAVYVLESGALATAARGAVIEARVECVSFINLGTILVSESDFGGIDAKGFAGGTFTNYGEIKGNGPAFYSGESENDSEDDSGEITFVMASGSLSSEDGPVILYESSHKFSLVLETSLENPQPFASITGDIEIHGGTNNYVSFTGDFEVSGTMVATNSTGVMKFSAAAQELPSVLDGINIGANTDYRIQTNYVIISNISFDAGSRTTTSLCDETTVDSIIASGGEHSFTIMNGSQVVDATFKEDAQVSLTNQGTMSGAVSIANGEVINEGMVSGSFVFGGSSFSHRETGSIEGSLVLGGSNMEFTNEGIINASSITLSAGLDLELTNSSALNASVHGSRVTADILNTGTIAGNISFEDSNIVFRQQNTVTADEITFKGGTAEFIVTGNTNADRITFDTLLDLDLDIRSGTNVASDIYIDNTTGRVTTAGEISGGGIRIFNSDTTFSQNGLVSGGGYSFTFGSVDFVNEENGVISGTTTSMQFVNTERADFTNNGTLSPGLWTFSNAAGTVTNNGVMTGTNHRASNSTVEYHQNGTLSSPVYAIDSAVSVFNNDGTISGNMTFDSGTTVFKSAAKVSSHTIAFRTGEFDFVNTETGVVTSTVFYFQNRAIGKVDNDGTITTDFGILNAADVTITNTGEMLGADHLFNGGRHLISGSNVAYNQAGTFDMRVEASAGSNVTIFNSGFISGDLYFDQSVANITNSHRLSGTTSLNNSTGTLTNNGAIGPGGITLSGAQTDYVINTFNGTISGVITSTDATVELDGGDSNLVIDATDGSFNFGLMRNGSDYEDLALVNSRYDQYLNYQGTDTDEISFAYDDDFFTTAKNGLEAMIFGFLAHGGKVEFLDDGYLLLFGGGGSLLIEGSGVDPSSFADDFLI